MAQPKVTQAAPGRLPANHRPARPPARSKSPPPTLSETPEPDLRMLLDEPAVRLLMRADRVDEPKMIAMFDAVRGQLRSNSTMAPVGKPRDRYRPGVGIMLLNARGDVFVGRRADVQHEAWQMPQGGINEDETPRQAARRELKEEIGTNNVKIVAESRGWLCYDVPEELAWKRSGTRWKGQCQKWFVMVFNGKESDIDLAGEHREFNAWRWVAVHELANIAVPFKRELYLNVIGEFAGIFRD